MKYRIQDNLDICGTLIILNCFVQIYYAISKLLLRLWVLKCCFLVPYVPLWLRAVDM